MVGIGIFETSPTIAASMPGLGPLLGIWIIGGFFSLCGALCYAELATSYPEDGGEYVYLGRAFGRSVSFLFAWSLVLIVRPGSIAAVAFPFARYFQTLWSPFQGTSLEPHSTILLAMSAVVVLTVLNCLTIDTAKWSQNILTLAKVLGLLIIVSVGLFVSAEPLVPSPVPAASGLDGLSLAFILVLFTYGGWNEIAYVSAEVKNPSKNILHALVWGVLAVTLLYVLLNISFWRALGYEGFATSEAVASEAVAMVFPSGAAAFVSLLICMSALGAIHGLIFTGARISYAFGSEYRPIRVLAYWSPRFRTPTVALLLQGGLSLAVILFAGSFNGTVVYTTAVIWLFFLLTGLALFVLNVKDAHRSRPYRVTGYPITPLLFCLSAMFLCYSAVEYDMKGSLIAFGILLAGLPVYWISKASTGTPEGS